MKDAVKITVIATGFKDSARINRRHRDVYASSTAGTSRGASDFEPESTFEPEPPPRVMQEAADLARVAVETVSPEVARVNPNFEAEDLDVPAFMRKRTDVM